VLEHQDRPREFLEMVKDLLKEGGYIAGSVPNRERLFADITWQFFHGDYPPHHFLRFSKEALEKALKILGFKNVKVYKLDFPKEDLPAYIEKKLIGNRVDKLKVYLKGKVLGNYRLANAVAVEDLSQVKSSFSAHLLKIMKKFRNALFYPLTFLYLHKPKENGINLYFQGKV
jgi:SAM-dependent methyltransferase